MCAAAGCGEHGRCAAAFLGGDVPVSRGACVCEPPYAGPLCEHDPCAAAGTQPCGAHGTCVGKGDTDFTCVCEPGHSGPRCETDCTAHCGGNGGVFPFNCVSS